MEEHLKEPSGDWFDVERSKAAQRFVRLEPRTFVRDLCDKPGDTSGKQKLQEMGIKHDNVSRVE